MLFSAARTAHICTHKTIINQWHNTGGSTPQVKTYIWRRNNSFEDNNVNVLSKEDRWFERGVKESIYIKLECLSLNRGGGLKQLLSPTIVISSDSLSTIDTLSHLALVTHMKASWTNNP